VKLEYLPWMASRSAGLVAFALVSATVVLGLAMSTRLVTGRRRALVRGMHEPLALAALGAMALHGVLLLFDGWLNAGPLQLVVPFTLEHAPFYTGLGVIAAYAMALFAGSFYLRRRLAPGRWRQIHQAAFVVWILGAIHALGAGSDAGAIVMRATLALMGLAIAGLLAARFGGGESRAPNPQPASERGLAPTAAAPDPPPAAPLWRDVYPDVTRGVSP
jgi:sulfoxide reductase heme-binding subunit YedZ